MKTASMIVVGVAALAGVAASFALAPQRIATASPTHPAKLAGGPGAPASACQDADGDGYGLGCALGNDCNDRDPAVHPGQGETCNLRDDDCNGLVDDAPACVSPNLDATRVKVPAGTFGMGSGSGAADELPIHVVTGAAFEMDRYEVTNARFKACVDAGQCKAPVLSSSHLRAHYFDDPKFADFPVVFVDWQQANAFCAFAGGRLPTEAEWERAARGTDAPRTYPWGDTAPDCVHANLGGPGSCVGDTDRVGRRPEGASPYGAMDMAGNVWEWTADWYDPGYYKKSPTKDPGGPASGTMRVARGGCFESGADTLRSTCRKPQLPTTWGYNVGLRCVYSKGGK